MEVHSGSRKRALLCVFAYNDKRISDVLSRIPAEREYDVLVSDDGSTDGSFQQLDLKDFALIQNPRNLGLGKSMKNAFRYALENSYDVFIIMAGNGKDDPVEVPRLLHPILNDKFDFVQGSRFLKGGCYKNIPFHRIIATRFIHPLLFRLAAHCGRVTETMNGFRALRTSILRDPRIDWQQDWLNGYEMEQYLQYKIVRLGYARTEVPVSKIYPPKGEKYSKVRPVSGWWNILKPLFYLSLGIRK